VKDAMVKVNNRERRLTDKSSRVRENRTRNEFKDS
jgi:hypothetical protein